MIPNTQTSDARSQGASTPLDHAKQLASTLLSERGEASGALAARELHEAMRALDAESRHDFQHYLATGFQPDKAALRAAAELYLTDATAEAAAALAQAADPPRQELLRRMNTAPGGTAALIAMRSDIAIRLRAEPELRVLDTDLRHLFGSWFNRGFLALRRIDWQSSAAVLEKLIAYEAVHEIKGWDDLRRPRRPSPGSGVDPVARFHLSNGARLERINWLGNTAPRAIEESFGIMVNYLYDHDTIEDNHEAFVRDGTIVRSRDVDSLLQTDATTGVRTKTPTGR